MKPNKPNKKHRQKQDSTFNLVKRLQRMPHKT